MEDALWTGFPEDITGYYGVSKLLLHTQTKAYKKQYEMNSIYLVPTNLYGPGDNFDSKSSHVVPALIKKVLDTKKRGSEHVEIWGTGKATREFLYIKDAAEGIVKATNEYNKITPVNLGTGIETSIEDLTKKIINLVSFKGKYKFNPSKPDGQPRRCLDVSRAKKEFGFEVKTSLEVGLSKTIEWYTR